MLAASNTQTPANRRFNEKASKGMRDRDLDARRGIISELFRVFSYLTMRCNRQYAKVALLLYPELNAQRHTDPDQAVAGFV
jgi:hypothetical protein